MFRIGEHVMYRNIGICEVEAIGKSAFLWTKKRLLHIAPLMRNEQFPVLCPRRCKCLYEKHHFPTGSLSVSGGTGKYADKALLRRKQTQLTAHYDELLTKYDVTDHLILFKELCQKEKKIKEDGKNSDKESPFIKIRLRSC